MCGNLIEEIIVGETRMDGVRVVEVCYVRKKTRKVKRSKNPEDKLTIYYAVDIVSVCSKLRFCVPFHI